MISVKACVRPAGTQPQLSLCRLYFNFNSPILQIAKLRLIEVSMVQLHDLSQNSPELKGPELIIPLFTPPCPRSCILQLGSHFCPCAVPSRPCPQTPMPRLLRPSLTPHQCPCSGPVVSRRNPHLGTLPGPLGNHPRCTPSPPMPHSLWGISGKASLHARAS